MKNLVCFYLHQRFLFLKDYDEIVPVYTSLRRNKAQIYLNREKLAPNTVFSPTKHPHGQLKPFVIENSSEIQPSFETTTASTKLRPRSGEKCYNGRIKSNNELSNYSAFQKSFFLNQRSRPINSAASQHS
jgi:hypothetical protein